MELCYIFKKYTHIVIVFSFPFALVSSWVKFAPYLESVRISFANIVDVKLMLYLYKFSLLFRILGLFLHRE